MRDDLGEREGRGLDVEAALDDLEVRRDGAEVLVGGLVGQVSETEGLGNLSGGEKFLELLRQVACNQLVFYSELVRMGR